MCVDSIEWLTKDKARDILYNFFNEVDKDFVPSLTDRVNIEEYVSKLTNFAENLIYFRNGKVVASVSTYMNTEIAFISSIAVKKQYNKRGIGSFMLHQTEKKAREYKCRRICLKVHCENKKAIIFYEKNGYKRSSMEEEWIMMEKKL